MVGRKRPDLRPALGAFLAGIDYELADPDDQPILDAALAGAVEVIVTGDRHFLSLALDQPRILTARSFLDAYAG